MIKNYNKYKETKFELLPTLPLTWSLRKIKFVASVYNGDSLNDDLKLQFESDDKEELAYISSKDINLETSEIQYDNGLRIPKNYPKFKIAPSGSTLLCIEGGSAGRKIAFTNQAVYFVNKLACLNVQEIVTSKYLYYSLKADIFQAQFKNSIAGIIGGVSISNLRNFYLSFPPSDDQQQIVNYLDYQTIIIDSLIRQKEKLVDLLKEKRQSIINEVITRGLNSQSTTKDSGVKWLGEIPIDWNIVKLKHITELITDGAHVSPDLSSADYPFISTVDLNKGEIDWSSCLKTSTESYKSLVKNGCKPVINDVLYSKDGTIGKTTIIKEDRDFVVASSLIIVRPNKSLINPIYLEYLLRSYIVNYQIESLLSGVALRRVSLQKFSNLTLVIPPYNEQIEFIDEIHKDQLVFRVLLDKLKSQINLLKEYRQSIISEAVTGKIDLEEWQPNDKQKA